MLGNLQYVLGWFYLFVLHSMWVFKRLLLGWQEVWEMCVGFSPSCWVCVDIILHDLRGVYQFVDIDCFSREHASFFSFVLWNFNIILLDHIDGIDYEL